MSTSPCLRKEQGRDVNGDNRASEQGASPGNLPTVESRDAALAWRRQDQGPIMMSTGGDHDVDVHVHFADRDDAEPVTRRSSTGTRARLRGRMSAGAARYLEARRSATRGRAAGPEPEQEDAGAGEGGERGEAEAASEAGSDSGDEGVVMDEPGAAPAGDPGFRRKLGVRLCAAGARAALRRRAPCLSRRRHHVYGNTAEV